MAYQWTQDLSVGIKEIDDQHKELFKIMDTLKEAMHKGEGKASIEKVINFLETYVVTHFGNEERYMKQYNYSEFASHKAQHAAYLADFFALKKDFQTNGANSSLVIKVQSGMIDWLIKHIGATDKRLGAFLATTSLAKAA